MCPQIDKREVANSAGRRQAGQTSSIYGDFVRDVEPVFLNVYTFASTSKVYASQTSAKCDTQTTHTYTHKQKVITKQQHLLNTELVHLKFVENEHMIRHFTKSSTSGFA